jgi:hypothetical protein
MTPHDLLRRHPILGALTPGEAQALLRGTRCRMVAAGRLSSSVTTTDGLYGVLGKRLIVVDGGEGKSLSSQVWSGSSSARCRSGWRSAAARRRG